MARWLNDRPAVFAALCAAIMLICGTLTSRDSASAIFFTGAALLAAISMIAGYSREWLGTWLPYIGRVITPCDDDGVPFDEGAVDQCRFETRAVVAAWFGRCVQIAYGPVEPRAVDPHNPKAWAKGDWLKGSELPEEEHRCPDRDTNSIADRQWPGPDHWQRRPDGTRTCSFCGSLHEEDFILICDAYARGEPGFRVEPTFKAYKVYANRPGVRNASEGGIKFYLWHVDRTDPERLKAKADVFSRASARAREDMIRVHAVGDRLA